MANSLFFNDPIFTDVFNDIIPSGFFDLKKSVQKAANEYNDTLFNTNGNIPLNVFVDSDGTKTWELAVPGRTKDDVSVKIEEDGNNGRMVLSVEVKGAEVTNDETKTGREYIIQKIKGLGGIKFSTYISPVYNTDEVKCKVENGLLTVKMTKWPEQQPKLITVE